MFRVCPSVRASVRPENLANTMSHKSREFHPILVTDVLGFRCGDF